jgi:hypothetical protein
LPSKMYIAIFNKYTTGLFIFFNINGQKKVRIFIKMGLHYIFEASLAVIGIVNTIQFCH